MTVAERIEQSITRHFMTVFPFTTNHHDTLFGGKAMALMDETAFMCATRFCRKTLVTVSSDRIDFKKAIPSGSMIEAIAEVIHVGRTSIKVRVDIFLEDMYVDGRELAISGVFSFVAIGEDKKPTPVLENLGVEEFS
ncbi:acyl-CoA thioesterase [Sphingobacterium hungaricum]|uniref:Acyl-CoA thioesterase n=1 Tax=Sphingobacterium hungaricum TaxID=2082723 RepID=A0A928YR14_9SPHI|nr:acyl-CoA thioesterase [Sphingobacterium hungaricum]MBE8713625.1 acyl-CoA thioesterase [Sphingobacterium hungaricum]